MSPKLTHAQLRSIPLLLKDKLPVAEIARKLGVSASTMQRAIDERRWERLPEDGRTPSVHDRCTDCGGKVLDDLKPCMVCEMRRNLAKKPAQRLYDSKSMLSSNKF